MSAMPRPYDARFSIAPMMDWTDRHCRFFLRLVTRHARLYTEMVTADAVVFGPRERLIGFDAARASDRAAARRVRTRAARRSRAHRRRLRLRRNQSQLRLPVRPGAERPLRGVPDARARAGCMNASPRWSRRSTFRSRVKCRIGVDEQEPREALAAFAEAVKAAGAAALIVHARKAWLEGLSPKDNRSIPPLDYGARLRAQARSSGLADHPQRRRSRTSRRPRAHLAHVDGVMLGRAAYQNPELLIDVDPALFGEEAPVADAFEAIEAFMPTIARGLARGERLHDYTRHLHGVFAGRPGARAYRQTLACEAIRPGAGLDVLQKALACVKRSSKRAIGRPEGRPSVDRLRAAE